ncbi:MAG: glucosyltransferase domain-containing protein [Clostridia bacterium]|nr:glucosyltransferase domain-containing protein [Clostridia bacterium]
MESKKRVRLAALAVFCSALIASGYRYLSLGFSGDSTLLFEGNDWLYQISLGRFLQPVYWLVRGRIVAPFVVGIFATSFFFICACLILDMLSIRHYAAVIALCTILTVNETISLSNATYLPWTDVYALALLFVSLGAWLDWKYKFGFLISPFCYMCTLALYPSYLTCGAVLLIFLYLTELIDGCNVGTVWKKGIRSVLSLFLGLLLYAGVLNIVLSYFGIHASYEYNGVGRLVEVTPESFLRHLPDAFLLPLIYLFHPGNRLIIPSHRALIPVPLNLCFLLLTAVLSFAVLGKRSRGARLTAVLLYLVLPLGMNFVYLISSGIINGLMIVSIYFFYLLPFVLLDRYNGTFQMRRLLEFPLLLLFCIYLGINVITSNRLAIKRDVEYRSTLSAFTRILSDAGRIDEYMPGTTPVHIIGYLPASRIAMMRDGFDDLNPMQGARYMYAAAYETSTEWYLKQNLGSSVRFLEDSGQWYEQCRAEIEALPSYPENGYIRMIDGVLVIHL